MKSLSNTDGANFADRLRIARRSAHLSQAQLAKRLNVASSAAAQWESPNGTMPRIDKLPAIAAMLGVNVEWLITGNAGKHGMHAELIDTSAVSLETFARDFDEELLLKQFRRLPARARSVVMGLLNELSARR